MSETRQNEIAVERNDGIVWLTLNRPQKANALTLDMMATLVRELRAMRLDAGVKAAVLTGSGERAFSGGVDVREQSALPKAEHRARRSELFFELLKSLVDFDKPLVAAVNGVASGGGCMMALLADAVVAADAAAFAVPEIDLGGPTFAGIAILYHVGGARLAADLVQSARRMPVAEAHARGIATRVVTSRELKAAADAVVRELAGKPQRAFALNKQWLNRPLREMLERAERDSAAARAGAGTA